MAPPHDLRRPFKRAAISDQQRRRETALLRQAQLRADSQARARRLASSILSFPSSSHPGPESETLDELKPEEELELDARGMEPEFEAGEDGSTPARVSSVLDAAKLPGGEARRWFARQLMIHEWMIDVPPRLNHDWYVFPRPAGKRCFVVSSNGTTVSRLRNGSILHHFPSSLPNGARTMSGPAHTYSILDCIFHEPDQTYYVIDMVCWRGYSLYDCTAEFRFFWLNSKLAESGACNPPSAYHRHRFGVVPVYECDQMGLQSAYTGPAPYVKDGLLFYNKHAHYHTGITPLALVWKDENCSQYLVDTDSKGQVLMQQQVVLELQADGKLVTSDDPPVVLGCMTEELLKQFSLRSGNLLRFAIRDEGIRFVDGKPEFHDLQYVGKSNRARAFADSYSKVLFQYTARHSPLQIGDLIAAIQQPNLPEDNRMTDIEMAA